MKRILIVAKLAVMVAVIVAIIGLGLFSATGVLAQTPTSPAGGVLKTDKGSAIPHFKHETVDPGTDKIHYSDGKDGTWEDTYEEPDPSPGVWGSEDEDDDDIPADFDFNERSEDWTDAEKTDINNFNQNRHPNASRLAEPTKKYNCHGYTFKESALWINGGLEQILKDQGWKKTAEEDVVLDCIVIYRDPGGNITHSGIVSGTTLGKVTKIRSKWGQGGVYNHTPNDVPQDNPHTPEFEGYGTPEYYCGGKKLAGCEPFDFGPPQPISSSTNPIEDFEYLITFNYQPGFDADSDGIDDYLDNCPTTYNPSQTDSNSNRIGDACEAVGGIDVIRYLPADALDLDAEYPGDTFDVYVNFTAPCDDFNSIGLTDLAPDGWEVEANNAWCDPVASYSTSHGNKVEYAWAASYTNGTNFSAMYKVTVPETADPGINEWPLCPDMDEAWLEYYFGEEGPYTSCVWGDYEMMVTVPGYVTGETRDVNANPLPDVEVLLKRGVGSPVTVRTDESTPDYSMICYNTGDDYWLRGKKNGYFTLDTRVVGGISPHNVNLSEYIDWSTPELLAVGNVTDFEGDYGLVPMACDMSYALRSVNLWLFWPTANEEWGLSVWKAMQSVHSWQNPS